MSAHRKPREAPGGFSCSRNSNVGLLPCFSHARPRTGQRALTAPEGRGGRRGTTVTSEGRNYFRAQEFFPARQGLRKESFHRSCEDRLRKHKLWPVGMVTVFRDTCLPWAGVLSCICHTLRVRHGGMCFPFLRHGSSSLKQGVWHSKTPPIPHSMPRMGGRLGTQKLGIGGKGCSGMGQHLYWVRKKSMATRV